MVLRIGSKIKSSATWIKHHFGEDSRGFLIYPYCGGSKGLREDSVKFCVYGGILAQLNAEDHPSSLARSTGPFREFFASVENALLDALPKDWKGRQVYEFNNHPDTAWDEMRKYIRRADRRLAKIEIPKELLP